MCEEDFIDHDKWFSDEEYEHWRDEELADEFAYYPGD